ncbi:MAG: hypothetical protein MJY61_04755 [Bacteroidales bacterium]|nr:hypothetical protein [Bacteroidales bacterium]
MKDNGGKRRDWFGYLMNFVAVCLGIAITFAGQGLINRKSEKNEVKSSLMLVRNELQDNLSYIEFSDSVLTRFSEAARFLIRYEGRYSQAPEDSMAVYCNVPLTAFEISHSEDALELLKNSSLFTKIKDLDLSLEIIHTYGAISDEMAVVKFYHEHKDKYLESAMDSNVKNILANDNITAEQLWGAITASREGRQFLRELSRLQMMHDSSYARNTIRSTIESIDRYIQR